MSIDKYVRWFESISRDDIDQVGGKGVNLGEISRAKLPIPYGFIVTAEAYRNFLSYNKLTQEIASILGILHHDNPDELREGAKRVRALILEAEVPSRLVMEIIHHYNEMRIKEEYYIKGKLSVFEESIHKLRSLHKGQRVVVRSSVAVEELNNATFIGEEEVYFNVIGDGNLIDKIRHIWASLFSDQAIYYRSKHNLDHFQMGMAVIVQRMIQSDRSGLAFSIDPVTGDNNKIVLEAVLGLGEYLNQEQAVSDHYEVDKYSFALLESQINYQTTKLIRHGLGEKEVPLTLTQGAVQKLTEGEIVRLALLVRDVEHHYLFPQQLEWAIENGRIYIIRSRPLKLSSRKMAQTQIDLSALSPILTGVPVARGVVSGVVQIIRERSDLERLSKNHILVTAQADLSYLSAFKKVAAVVTAYGGRTSHAAIMAHEVGLPAIVGVNEVLDKLHSGEIITINGATGEIFAGDVRGVLQSMSRVEAENFQTRIRIYLSLSQLRKPYEQVVSQNAGVGVFRSEAFFKSLRRHPKKMIAEGRRQEIVGGLISLLEDLSRSFAPRPVIYRICNLTTNEYCKLEGGKEFEVNEENPQLGFHGVSRYLSDQEFLDIELEAIKKAHDTGLMNLNLLVPFVRLSWEFAHFKMRLDKFGLLNLPHFKLLVSVGVPALVLELEELLKVGVDGVVLDVDDLTTLTLGVDPFNRQVAHLYDERSPAVLQLLGQAIKICKGYNVPVLVFGRALANYPDLLVKLTNWQVDGVVVPPDWFHKTQELIAKAEKTVKS